MGLPMNYTAFFVHMSNGIGNLFDDVPTEVFTKVGHTYDTVEKFSTIAQFQYEKVVFIGFGERDELYDILMLYTSHDLNFFENVCSLLNVDQTSDYKLINEMMLLAVIDQQNFEARKK
jgi:hypothetical protein